MTVERWTDSGPKTPWIFCPFQNGRRNIHIDFVSWFLSVLFTMSSNVSISLLYTLMFVWINIFRVIILSWILYARFKMWTVDPLARFNTASQCLIYWQMLANRRNWNKSSLIVPRWHYVVHVNICIIISLIYTKTAFCPTNIALFAVRVMLCFLMCPTMFLYY